MPVTVFFAAGPANWKEYRDPLNAAFAEAGLDVMMSDTVADPRAVDYIVFAPGGLIEDFGPYVNCKAVLNLWAGVERLVTNTTLTQPLARMVDPAMTESMVEWVTAHILRLHLNIDADILGQNGIWRHDPARATKIARERPVTILGFGELGRACGRALMALGFPVTGWSRRPVLLEGARCLSGPEGLDAALTGAEAVVLLLPFTAETENILNERTLALLEPGAFVINPGRGPLIDDDALLAALDTGQVAQATLDVFRQEPLPREHPYWAHPNVTVTPHIAATTRPVTASAVVAENIRRGEAGEPFLHLVDRSRGY